MTLQTNPIEFNRQAWDERVRRGLVFTRPITSQELAEPRKAVDPWALEDGLVDKRILCLGAGGGRQGPAYAAAGGLVTVVDVSEAQLEIDRKFARERLLDIRTVRASMDDLSVLSDASYDIVIQPVSTCYVPDISRVYTEIARVMIPGGLYISQHKQPASLQADTRRGLQGYELLEPYYRQGPLPQVAGSPHREADTIEFLHRWEQLIGWMCRSGFVIEDLAEPDHGSPLAKANTFEDRSRFVPPYVRVKARRIAGEASPCSAHKNIIHA